MPSTSCNSLSQQGRDQVRQMVAHASEPIAPFWPMRTMIAQNPIHGLEYLPFDLAVRKGRHLLGGNGYLPNEEYRQFYRDGRITPQSLDRALARVGPRPERHDSLQKGKRQVTAQDVWQVHLLFGLEPLDPSLFEWAWTEDGASKRFRPDLPEETRKRIIERTIHECEQCRNHPEEAYLTNLWNSTLAVLNLSDSHVAHQSSENPHPKATENEQGLYTFPFRINEQSVIGWIVYRVRGW